MTSETHIRTTPGSTIDRQDGHRKSPHPITRRAALAGAVAVGAPTGSKIAFAQSKGPLTMRIWSNDQVQQREWYQIRVKQFMEQNRNIKIAYQWFPFGDLG